MARKLYFLLRYDTEDTFFWRMRGFFEKVIEVHRNNSIPATFFCQGKAIRLRKNEFRGFWQTIQNDPLFDLQDHSYSHIGVGYQNGKPIETIRKDYEHSFRLHKQLFGKLPIGISICGVRNAGPCLDGFDATPQSRAEFEMLAQLGIKFIDTFLSGKNKTTDFISYSSLGHPEMLGFPSGESDTSWMYRRKYGEPLKYIEQKIEQTAKLEKPFSLLLHDWVAWAKSPEKHSLSHVVHIAEKARELGFTLVTHQWCWEHRNELVE